MLAWLDQTGRGQRALEARSGHARTPSRNPGVFAIALSVGRRFSTKMVLVDSPNQRPADVNLPHWQRGVPCAVDVAVSHPSQTSPVNRGNLSPDASASTLASKAKEQSKHRKYDAQCAAQGVDFKAAMVCCYGSWLAEGESIVKTLAERCAVRMGRSSSVVKGEF